MGDLKSHLRENVFPHGAGNYIILQAHPGWGKTACLGAALFLGEQESFLEGRPIWVGKLEEIYEFVQIAEDIENAITMIVDDFHNQHFVQREEVNN